MLERIDTELIDPEGNTRRILQKDSGGTGDCDWESSNGCRRGIVKRELADLLWWPSIRREVMREESPNEEPIRTRRLGVGWVL